jgi:hypothetical protein
MELVFRTEQTRCHHHQLLFYLITLVVSLVGLIFVFSSPFKNARHPSFNRKYHNMAAILRKTGLLWTLYLLAGFRCLFTHQCSKVETILWINGHHNAFLDQFFKYFTHLGDGLFYIALIVVLFWWNRNAGWKALAAYALTSIVAQVMKNYVFGDALRPRAILNDDSKLHFIDGVEIYFLSSFPSGHYFSITLHCC